MRLRSSLVTRVFSPSNEDASLVAMATCVKGSDFSQAAESAGLTAAKSSQSKAIKRALVPHSEV